MKLEKAKEILTDILRYVKPGDPPDEHDAIKLGIEALKWRDLMERDYGSWCGPPLPGETEE